MFALTQEAWDEMEAERTAWPVNPMQEAHAEAMQLGLPCPFDCAACERRAAEHTHPTVCGHPVTCDDEHCFYEDRMPLLVACAACALPDAPDCGHSGCAAHPDPWEVPF